jgi:V8-like Glu-specific endopeptidase
MATTQEDVRSDVTPTNGNTTTTDAPYLEAGSPGQENERLLELGLEPIADLATITEEYDESAPGYDEVSSQDTPSAEQLPQPDQEENLPDAYFGSFDEHADEVVIGRDDRRRITATNRYPWSATCSLRIATRTGKTYIGTGWFIGPRTIMTAGHCVYLHNEGGWAKSITVMPGRNGSSMPFGAHVATHFRSVTGWTGSRQRSNDFGCIILPENNRLGVRTGSFGFAYMSDATLRQKYLNLTGYPGDKPAGTQWYHARRTKSVTSRTIVYDIDTAGGQSGSAVYHIKDGKRYAVGIHTNGSQSGNSATRITKGVFNFMKSWKAMGQ